MQPQTEQPALVPLERRDVWIALIPAVVLAIFAAFRIHTEVCGQYHDDAIYVITAKSLAEGNGYRLTQLPGEPPQTKYPPLYPALLALLWKLWPSFPENLILLQGFSLLCGIAFLISSYCYLVRFGHATRGIAFSACLLCSVSFPFVFFAIVTMSETLFGLLLVGLLWWVESAMRDPEPRAANDLFGGLLLALPFLCRSIGLIFIPPVLLLLWRNGKRWRWASVGALAATLPWLLWTVSSASDWKKDPIQGYYTDYLGWWTQGFPALTNVITFNVLSILTAVGGSLMDGLAEPLRQQGNYTGWFFFTAVPGFIALIVLGADVLRGRALATLLASYILLVCVWPWVPHRFLMPILPLLTVYLLRGLMAPVSQPNLGRLWPRLAFGMMALSLFASSVGFVNAIRVRHELDSPNPEMTERKYSWRQFRALHDWIQTHSDPKDVLASGADPLLSLYTGRKAYYPILCPPMALFYGSPYPTEEVYAQSLRAFDHYRPRYLVLTTGFAAEDEFRAWIDLVRERNPERLHLVYTDESDPRFAVYEIRHPSELARKP